MSGDADSTDADGRVDGLPVHVAACVSLAAFGLSAAVDGVVRASSGGFDFAAGGSLVGGLGVAVAAAYALIDDGEEFDGWLGVLSILSGVVYTVGTVVGLVS